MKSSWLVVLAVVVALLVSSSAQAQDLFYRGFLETTDGTPVEAVDEVTIRLWRSAGGTVLSELACSFAANPTVDEGHFRVPLDTTCRDVIGVETALWLEVEVDFGGDTEVFERFPLGAVPFARHAERAEDFEISGFLSLRWRIVTESFTTTSSFVLAQADCPDGWTVVGGGCSTGGAELFAAGPQPAGDRYACGANNPGGLSQTLTAYAICLPLTPITE